jgi:hypothetical protein
MALHARQIRRALRAAQRRADLPLYPKLQRDGELLPPDAPPKSPQKGSTTTPVLKDIVLVGDDTGPLAVFAGATRHPGPKVVAA